MKNKTGREGENFARKYLKKKGLKIMMTNYRTPIGEIDIIARDRDTIVFIEVKTRQTLSFGYPFEAVTRKKREKLKKLALYYLKNEEKAEVPVRFDVMGLHLKDGTYEVQHIIDAFEV
jgi:putative endonuclease